MHHRILTAEMLACDHCRVLYILECNGLKVLSDLFLFLTTETHLVEAKVHLTQVSYSIMPVRIFSLLCYWTK